MNALAESMTIDKVYPWGRSFDEYVRMFHLSEADLRKRILCCADGPAAFNCEMTRRGGRIVSCDPLYTFNAEQIRQRIEATREVLVEQARENANRFVWDRIGSPADLGRLRMESMAQFLTDFEHGRLEERYVAQSLPRLDFGDGSFDMALCSHFLFLYSDEFSLDFHLLSVLEMTRLAHEARIFPLLDMHGSRSVHLDPLITSLKHHGRAVRIETVPYEFQRGGNEMLRVIR
ncbi:MAG TPA: hypothetical protein VH518_17690 [Tepidisphaeraceae bacterium]|jgi:hypothetical protein